MRLSPSSRRLPSLRRLLTYPITIALHGAVVYFALKAELDTRLQLRGARRALAMPRMGDVVPLPIRREDAAGAPEVDGRVLPFRALDREGEALPGSSDAPLPNCLYCEFVSIGAVTYCAQYHEEIMFESIAAMDCEGYKLDEDALLTWGD